MSLPQVLSRSEWLAARRELLAKEKELTRARDALNAERRRLPMVRVDKDYVFTGPAGEARLLDLFGRHLQLIVGHFMFDPDWEDGCPSCSAGADEVSRGLIEHLHARDTHLVYVSRAPLEKLERYRAKKGWEFPWYSSHGSDFNHDFGVTIDLARPHRAGPAGGVGGAEGPRGERAELDAGLRGLTRARPAPAADNRG